MKKKVEVIDENQAAVIHLEPGEEFNAIYDHKERNQSGGYRHYFKEQYGSQTESYLLFETTVLAKRLKDAHPGERYYITRLEDGTNQNGQSYKNFKVEHEAEVPIKTVEIKKAEEVNNGKTNGLI